ncbi:hypothetical protein AB1Y20_020146 [Prymnesium parvum]|uniref:Uncharacterized protein n=1 Tax=Prymnesium parvum TaxID=97485 RepID=A0AB34JWA2_PRYPA
MWTGYERHHSVDEAVDALLWPSLVHDLRSSPPSASELRLVAHASFRHQWWRWRKRTSLAAATSWFWRHSWFFRFRSRVARAVSIAARLALLRRRTVRAPLVRWRRHGWAREREAHHAERVRRGSAILRRALARRRVGSALRSWWQHAWQQRAREALWLQTGRSFPHARGSPPRSHQEHAGMGRLRAAFSHWTARASAHLCLARKTHAAARWPYARCLAAWRRHVAARLMGQLCAERKALLAGAVAWRRTHARASIARALRRWRQSTHRRLTPRPQRQVAGAFTCWRRRHFFAQRHEALSPLIRRRTLRAYHHWWMRHTSRVALDAARSLAAQAKSCRRVLRSWRSSASAEGSARRRLRRSSARVQWACIGRHFRHLRRACLSRHSRLGWTAEGRAAAARCLRRAAVRRWRRHCRAACLAARRAVHRAVHLVGGALRVWARTSRHAVLQHGATRLHSRRAVAAAWREWRAAARRGAAATPSTAGRPAREERPPARAAWAAARLREAWRRLRQEAEARRLEARWAEAAAEFTPARRAYPPAAASEPGGLPDGAASPCSWPGRRRRRSVIERGRVWAERLQRHEAQPVWIPLYPMWLDGGGKRLEGSRERLKGGEALGSNAAHDGGHEYWWGNSEPHHESGRGRASALTLEWVPRAGNTVHGSRSSWQFSSTSAP